MKKADRGRRRADVALLSPRVDVLANLGDERRSSFSYAVLRSVSSAGNHRCDGMSGAYGDRGNSGWSAIVGVCVLRVLCALRGEAGLLWERCRATAQRRQRRDATARHQRSVEGRLDHRDRQRVYRAQCRLRRVTDAPSPAPPRSTTIASPVGRHAASRPVCLVCGRLGGVTTRGHPERQGGAGRRKDGDDGDS